MAKEKDLQLAKQYFEEGKVLQKEVKYEEAVEVLAKASELYKKWEKWEDWIEANNSIGENYRHLSKHEQAITHLQSVLEKGKKKLGENHLKIASSINKLGMCYYTKGAYDFAIDLHQQALTIYQKTTDKDYLKVATNLNNLGICYKAKGEYDLAIDFHQQALAIRQKKLDKQHDDVAISFNNLGMCYYAKGEYELAIDFHQKALAIRQKSSNRNEPTIAHSLNNIGISYKAKGEYDLAIDFHQQALVMRQHSIGKRHASVAGSFNNLGMCYYAKGQYDFAINFHQQALAIWRESLGSEHPFVALSLNNQGICYYVKGDYDLSIGFHQEALTIRQISLGKQHPYVAMSLTNLGICYYAKGDYDLAIGFHQEALTIRQISLGKYHPAVASCLNNMGICYKARGEYNVAIGIHEEALSIRQKSLGKQHPDTVESLCNLASCYHAKGDCELAIRFLKESLDIYEQSLGKDHPNVANCLNSLGQCYKEQKAYELAITQYQKALMILVPSFQKTTPFKNPDLIAYSSGYYLLDTIFKKAQAFVASYIYASSNLKELQAALSTICLATKLITDIRQSYKTEGAKHTLAEEASAIYDQAIQITLKTAQVYQDLPKIPQHPEFANIPYTIQGCKTLAFDFTEQSKAILLLSSLKDSEAKASANIPADLLEKEKQLKIELNYLDNSIATQEAKGDQKDEELLSKFQSQHFEYKQQYDELIEQFEADYPAYYRLKYAVETASVEEVQNYLSLNNETIEPYSHKTILISYHIAPKTIYIFAITATTYHIHPIEKPDNFAQLLEDFQDAITLADIGDYIHSAGALFDLLLKPVLESTQVIDKLLIIPHNELTTLTFDALIDTRKLTAESRADMMASHDFSALPYLIKDFDISYHYSATMLLHSVARQESAAPQPASFIGFAPVNFDGSDNTELALASNRGQTKVLRSNRAGETALSKLPSTENEVKEVFNLFEAEQLEAKAFLYASANKQNLFENAQHHKYVLIATHGYAQGGNAGLSGIYLAPQIEARGQKPEVREEEGQGSEVRSQEEKKMVDKIISTENNNRTIKQSQQSNNYILHTSEAYHLSLNAELVVLSSCSSGVGKLVTGEGMMAMNRGFLYAGASNIIFTYFDIPDQSSGELVRLLFKHILEGDSYAAALRKAKIALLSQNLKTPEDWAGYALIGG